MLKKMIKKFKEKYIKIEFPRNFEYYNDRFEVNDWTVKKEAKSFGGVTLTVSFKGTKIAQTDRDKDFSYMISEIVFEPGFEDLKPEINQVLKAASQKRIDEEKEELRKKQELVKQAKAETKFLGPF
jgi:hypothetical protein